MLKNIIHPVTGIVYKMGRLRPKLRPKLHLNKYLNLSTIPSPPASCDYTQKAMPSLSNIYGNDQLGCCVIAGGAHVEGIFTGNANGGKPLVYTLDQIVKMYGEVGGYIPGRPDTDNGCDEHTFLNFWKTKGFAGGHKISGYVGVDATKPEEYTAALWLFENLYLGVELPDGWVNPMPSAPGFIWDVEGDPDPENGHCFIGAKYDPSGNVGIDTWGMLGTITKAAMNKYAVPNVGGELYAILSSDSIIAASKKAPNGFDLDQLKHDLDLFSK